MFTMYFQVNPSTSRDTSLWTRLPHWHLCEQQGQKHCANYQSCALSLYICSLSELKLQKEMSVAELCDKPAKARPVSCLTEF